MADMLRAAKSPRLSLTALRKRGLVWVALLAIVVTVGWSAWPPPAAAQAAEKQPAAETPAPTPTVISKIPTQEKVVALTFDAGADAGHTLTILSILEAGGVKATFFVTGDWLDKCPELGAAIAARGHALGNHTRTHPHLTQLADADIAAELVSTEEKALQACGRTTQPFFRPPFGERDERVDRLVAAAGYAYEIMWTIDSLDWKMLSADDLYRRVVDNVVPGAIVLMHVGSQTNEPDALPRIIKQLKEDGYRFGTLSELLLERPSDDTTLYTVAPGDTLSSIARHFGVRVPDLLAVNGLASPDAIEAGLVLVIPAPGPGDGGNPGDGGTPGDDQGGSGQDGGGGPDAGGGSAAPPAGLLARAAWWLGRVWHHLWDFVRSLFLRRS